MDDPSCGHFDKSSIAQKNRTEKTEVNSSSGEEKSPPDELPGFPLPVSIAVLIMTGVADADFCAVRLSAPDRIAATAASWAGIAALSLGRAAADLFHMLIIDFRHCDQLLFVRTNFMVSLPDYTKILS